MIPPFDGFGVLPPGQHRATLAEIQERFGRQSEIRQVQMESIRWMADLARRAGVQTIILNGSFVTDIMEPNDVDCVLLFSAHGSRNKRAVKQLRKGLPFLSIYLAEQADFDLFVGQIFAQDRMGLRKGMIEVLDAASSQ